MRYQNRTTQFAIDRNSGMKPRGSARAGGRPIGAATSKQKKANYCAGHRFAPQISRV